MVWFFKNSTARTHGYFIFNIAPSLQTYQHPLLFGWRGKMDMRVIPPIPVCKYKTPEFRVCHSSPWGDIYYFVLSPVHSDDAWCHIHSSAVEEDYYGMTRISMGRQIQRTCSWQIAALQSCGIQARLQKAVSDQRQMHCHCRAPDKQTKSLKLTARCFIIHVWSHTALPSSCTAGRVDHMPPGEAV